jgi:O-antigen/teichoic acid export membrane protein
LARRACYARLEPRRAAAASAAYLALLVGSGALLSAAGRLSPATAFGALAVASVVPAWCLAHRFDVRPGSPGALAVAGEVLREHWRLGRWAAASFVFRWLPRNIYFVTLPWLAGLDATAVLLAMLNLVAPALQINIALSTLFIPAYRSSRAQLGRAGFLGRGLVMVGVPSLAWWALAVAFREPLIALLYRGRYAGYTDLVWILGALPLLTGLVTVLGSMLFAERRLPAFFWSFVAGSVAAATAGVALAARWGAGGAAAGMLLAYAVVAASMAWTALRPPPAGGRAAASGGRGAR